MLKVAPCMVGCAVIWSYIQIFLALWVLALCIVMGLCYASSAIIETVFVKFVLEESQLNMHNCSCRKHVVIPNG